MAKITVHIEADSPFDFRAALLGLIDGTGASAAAAIEPAKATKARKTAEGKTPESVAASESAADPAPAADLLPATKEKRKSPWKTFARLSSRSNPRFHGN